MHTDVDTPTPLHSILRAIARAQRNVLAIPFDLARDNYARSVRAGLIERSLLGSARFTRAVNAAEQMALGPWSAER